MTPGEGTLRYYGKTSIGVDVPTKAMLKQLAGSMDVSDYLREHARAELAKRGKGRALPGQELAVSESTLPAISSKLDSLMNCIRQFMDIMLLRMDMVETKQNKQLSMNTGSVVQ